MVSFLCAFVLLLLLRKNVKFFGAESVEENTEDAENPLCEDVCTEESCEEVCEEETPCEKD